MAFDFPNTPNVGDTYTDATSGASYRWNGTAWVGGITGIGLMQIKDTRYLNAGNFTHTRDPKSNGAADIWLLGGSGARAAQAWASGQAVLSGQPGGGAVTIKWKYALGPSCPVVVGAGAAASGNGGTSSFDTVLTALGGGSSYTTAGASNTNLVCGGGAGGVAGSSGDENYTGQAGAICTWINTGAFLPGGPDLFITLRDCIRRLVSPTANSTASIAAFAGPQGAVIVREYLYP